MAAPVVTLTGSAPAVVSGPAKVTFSYSLVLPVAVSSALWRTHQDAHLPAGSTGVTLDNAAVGPAQVTQSGGNDIVVATGPSGLSAGTHLLTFSASVPAGQSATTSSSLSVDYNDGAAQTVSSGAVLVAINQPDLAIALTPQSGEDPGMVGPLGTGRIAALAVDIRNVGYGSPQTSMLISLPAGLGLALPGVARATADNGSLLPCAATPADPQQVVCALGALAHTAATDDPTFEIPLISTPHPPVGQTAPITVSIAPADASQGVDTNATNNSVQFPVRFTGKARLSYQLSTTQASVAVGHTTRVKVSVTNSGPNVAGETVGIIALENPHFSVVGFTGKTLPLSASSGSGSVTAPSALLQSLANRMKPGAFATVTGGNKAAGALAEDPGVIWQVGGIPSGRSVSAFLTLKATSLGSDSLALIAISDAADPACANLACTPPTLSVKAIAAAVSPVTPVSAPSTGPGSTTAQPAGGGTALADTGEESSAQLSLAAGMLMLGSALLLLIRRERPSRGRHY